jgi:rubredoxin
MPETTESLPTVQQIPAEDFGPIIDGHAWWIVDAHDLLCPNCGASASLPLGMTCRDHRPVLSPEGTKLLDRPCDTCGGESECWYDGPQQIDCPDCIDGRHTFTVEAFAQCICNGDSPPRPRCPGVGPHTHRLSIVPGMIVSLVQYGEHATVGHYIVRVNDRWFRIDNTVGPITSHGEVLDFPSGARPGRWAVQCKVAS